jgi:hypothetical protein
MPDDQARSHWRLGLRDHVGIGLFHGALATAPAPAPDDSKQSQLELVKGETITVPVVKDGAVAGYFLGKMSFMMNKEMIKNVSLPLTEMTTDELFTLLVGNKMIDVTNMKAFDPQAFRDLIKKNINEPSWRRVHRPGYAGTDGLHLQGRGWCHAPLGIRQKPESR